MLAALALLPLVSPNADLPVTVPPAWADRVVYCRTFRRPAADVVVPGLDERGTPETVPDGFLGPGGLTGGPRALRLFGEVLSAHRPITVSLWWKLRADAGSNAGFNIVQLSGRQGFLSTFVRSGPWCGLEKPAAVLQVYYLPGIRNVNDIYDRGVQERGDLQAGLWHHTAVVVSGGATVAVWTDGRKVAEAALVGRVLSAEDAVRAVEVGGGGPDLVVDEVIVLNRPLTGPEISEYVAASRQMRDAGWLADE